MGLKSKSFAIITLLFLLLFALFYILIFAFGNSGNFVIYISVLIAVGMILLQYAIGPFLIGWIFRVRWINYDELASNYPNLYQIITNTSRKYNHKLPRVGIIEDGNPNAFTFGWTRNKARIVITRGIIDLLDKDEQTAVVGHELGHIDHGDFIIMVIVSAIPMIAYFIFQTLYWSTFRRRGRSSRSSGYILIVMIAAYIVYILGYMISLIISRIREYWADEFSAEETGNANNLSKALVTIAYGLTGGKKSKLADQTEMLAISKAEEKEIKQKKGGFSKGMALRGFGIADPKASKNLFFAAAAYSGNTLESVETAAAWDLYNPWARYFEIFGTHPLPAKRILALNKISESQNIQPEVDLSQTKKMAQEQAGKTMWDEFLVDIFIYELPWIIFYAAIIFTVIWALTFVFSARYFFGVSNLGIFWVWALLFIGIGKVIKTEYKYRGGYKPMNTADCLQHLKVSPIRPVPVIIEGTLIGRGIPGFILSEDMVIQDNTGFMRIDYRFGLKIVDWWWAITKIEKYKGHKMRIYGWYRRAPGPYVQVKKIEVMGNVHRNHAKLMAYFGTFILWALGLLLFYIFF